VELRKEVEGLGYSSVVECLSGMCKALGSILSTIGKERKKRNGVKNKNIN
jgi:hypothetical protein